MADFGFFSDTDDESAVEEVISQAQDMFVLEQLSALNCSAFTDSDSVLPSDLDSRFRKLKSFPATVSHTTHLNRERDHLHPFKYSTSSAHSPRWKYEYPFKCKSSSNQPSVSVSDSDFIPPDAFLTPSLPSPRHRSSSNCRSFSSPLSLDSSPPKKSGCFWCSPRKLFKKNYNKEHDNSMLATALYTDEYVSLSVKEHQKMLNKAIKEQDKISLEAEKIYSQLGKAGISEDDLSFSYHTKSR